MKKFLLGMSLAVAVLFVSTPKEANAMSITYTGSCSNGWAPIYELEFNGRGGLYWQFAGLRGC